MALDALANKDAGAVAKNCLLQRISKARRELHAARGQRTALGGIAGEKRTPKT